jgi:N-acetylglucosaminyldiphosphoundecaprenol N-acetyl-beta-D-mannosaminyltransferase
MMTEAAMTTESSAMAPIWVWGLPLTPYTMSETLDRIDRMVAERTPAFFITANLNYAMLCEKRSDLRAINDKAAFIVADGMPLPNALPVPI